MHFSFSFRPTSFKSIIIMFKVVPFNNYVVIRPFIFKVIFLSNYSSASDSERHLSSRCCSSSIDPSGMDQGGSGLTGQGSGRSRALLTGQTGFGVWSVGFVLRAAAKVVIHLQYRMSSLVRAHMHKQKNKMTMIQLDTLYIVQLSLYLPNATMHPCKETIKGKQKHLLYQVGLFVYKLG